MSSIINAGTSGVTITGSTSTVLSLATNGTTRLNIDASGNLAVGTGNLTFSSTGQRITGDFGNATPSNRVMFQNSVTNANTQVEVIPNGTATVSGIVLSNNSDPNNCSNFFVGTVGTTDCRLSGNSRGTGTLLPMTFYTGGSERMRLSTTGELGLGIAAPTIPLQIGKGGGGNPATSGTTQTYGIARIGSGGVAALDVGTYSAGQVWMQGVNVTNLASNFDLVLQPNGGNVGIGGTASAFAKVHALGTLPSSSNATQVFRASGEIPSGTTSTAEMFVTVPSTQAASFTLTHLRHYVAVQDTIGAGSTVTNQVGFRVSNTLTGATNNFGFYSDIASGSNRFNFYANGTAQNYFAGATTFGTTSTNPVGGNVAGTVIAANGTLGITRDSEAALLVNRKTNDGDLVQFFQDGILEGSISVAGNTISYNPFMGSHYTEIVGAMPTLKGTVLESLDELVDGKYSNQDRLPKAKISDTAGSSSVYGVYFAPDSDPDTNDGILAAALGASWVRIAAGVTVQRGDLLESNGDGCAKVQSDDIIRSKTIGKVTSTTVADTYADGSYIVPCVLYCG